MSLFKHRFISPIHMFVLFSFVYYFDKYFPQDTFPIGIVLKIFNQEKYKTRGRDRGCNKRRRKNRRNSCVCVHATWRRHIHIYKRDRLERHIWEPVACVLCSFIQLFTGHVFRRTPRECHYVVASKASVHAIRSHPDLHEFPRGCGFAFNCERDSSQSER